MSTGKGLFTITRRGGSSSTCRPYTFKVQGADEILRVGQGTAATSLTRRTGRR